MQEGDVHWERQSSEPCRVWTVPAPRDRREASGHVQCRRIIHMNGLAVVSCYGSPSTSLSETPQMAIMLNATEKKLLFIRKGLGYEQRYSGGDGAGQKYENG